MSRLIIMLDSQQNLNILSLPSEERDLNLINYQSLKTLTNPSFPQTDVLGCNVEDFAESLELLQNKDHKVYLLIY